MRIFIVLFLVPTFNLSDAMVKPKGIAFQKIYECSTIAIENNAKTCTS